MGDHLTTLLFADTGLSGLSGLCGSLAVERHERATSVERDESRDFTGFAASYQRTSYRYKARRIPALRRDLVRNARRRALFLDKDGTILQDVPYNVVPLRMRFAAGAARAMARFASLEWPICVISNQAGVARGKFRLHSLTAVARCLHRKLARQGATLSAFEFCPYHPQGTVAPFDRDSYRRKPAAGMLEDAGRRHRVALADSWFIGDILDDVEAGNRAGCRTILIHNGNETEWRGLHSADGLRMPYAFARDLNHAASIVMAALRTPQRRPHRPAAHATQG